MFSSKEVGNEFANCKLPTVVFLIHALVPLCPLHTRNVYWNKNQTDWPARTQLIRGLELIQVLKAHNLQHLKYLVMRMLASISWPLPGCLSLKIKASHFGLVVHAVHLAKSTLIETLTTLSVSFHSFCPYLTGWLDAICMQDTPLVLAYAFLGSLGLFITMDLMRPAKTC